MSFRTGKLGAAGLLPFDSAILAISCEDKVLDLGFFASSLLLFSCVSPSEVTVKDFLRIDFNSVDTKPAVCAYADLPLFTAGLLVAGDDALRSGLLSGVAGGCKLSCSADAGSVAAVAGLLLPSLHNAYDGSLVPLVLPLLPPVRTACCLAAGKEGAARLAPAEFCAAAPPT